MTPASPQTLITELCTHLQGTHDLAALATVAKAAEWLKQNPPSAPVVDPLSSVRLEKLLTAVDMALGGYRMSAISLVSDVSASLEQSGKGSLMARVLIPNWKKDSSVAEYVAGPVEKSVTNREADEGWARGQH